MRLQRLKELQERKSESRQTFQETWSSNCVTLDRFIALGDNVALWMRPIGEMVVCETLSTKQYNIV